MSDQVRDGVQHIVDERRRQLERKGYDAVHDNRYHRGQLAMAAACYAAPEKIFIQRQYARQILLEDPWPWDASFDDRPDRGGEVDRRGQSVAARVRELARAGALIAAEIDRLLRQGETELEELAVGQIWSNVRITFDDGEERCAKVRLLEKCGEEWRIELVPVRPDTARFLDEVTIRSGRLVR